MSSSPQTLLRRDGVPPDDRAARRSAASRLGETGGPAEAPLPLPLWHETDPSVIRHLPAATLATFTVAVAPALLANALVTLHGVGGAAIAFACAVALSLVLAVAGATLWKRLRGSRGIVFADLMLWTFARRVWAERRLRRIGAAYSAAVDKGGGRVELLEGLSRLLETRNPYTFGHCRRVARHAERIALAMHLPPAEVAEVRAAALIHDVGKVYTPVEILHKPAALTDAEFDVVKRHCADGARMLARAGQWRLAAIVRHHHERLDGSGYPDSLCGDEIPRAARIIAVADTFDALTSHRPYRRARSQEEGMAVLTEESGVRLDAEAVAAFVDGHVPRRGLATVVFSLAALARLAPVQLLPGGLLSGASVAGLLPAVGAAGLLAAAPGTRYERGPLASTSELYAAASTPAHEGVSLPFANPVPTRSGGRPWRSRGPGAAVQPSAPVAPSAFPTTSAAPVPPAARVVPAPPLPPEPNGDSRAGEGPVAAVVHAVGTLVPAAAPAVPAVPVSTSSPTPVGSGQAVVSTIVVPEAHEALGTVTGATASVLPGR